MARPPSKITVRERAPTVRRSTRDGAVEGEAYSQVRRRVASYPGGTHRAELEGPAGKEELVVYEVTAGIEPATRTADRYRAADAQRTVLEKMNVRNAAFWGRNS